MDKSYVIAVALIALGFVAVMLVAVPDVPILPVIIVAGGVAALFFVFWFFGTYLPLQRFRPLERTFGFRGMAGSPDTLSGLWEGRAVKIRYEEWRRSERARLYIRLSHQTAGVPEVLFHRENLFHRLAKKFGLSHEVQSHDPRFDSRVYVESEGDAHVAALLNSSEIRLQVLSLLEIRRSEITLTPDAVILKIRGHVGWTKYFKPDEVEKILRLLLALSNSSSGATGAVRPSVYEEREPIFSAEGTFRERMALLRDPARAAIFIASLLLFLGPLLFFWGTWYPPVSWQLHRWGLAAAGASLALYIPLTFSLVRGRSHSHRTFSTFLFIGLIAFTSFWIGFFTVVNGLLDQNPRFVVKTQVIGHMNKGSQIKVYLPISGEERSVLVKVRPEVFRSLQRGERLSVVLSPGALNEPWIVGPVDGKELTFAPRN